MSKFLIGTNGRALRGKSSLQAATKTRIPNGVCNAFSEVELLDCRLQLGEMKAMKIGAVRVIPAENKGLHK